MSEIKRSGSEDAAVIEARRDFNEIEMNMIRAGRIADAKRHWHDRKDGGQ